MSYVTSIMNNQRFILNLSSDSQIRQMYLETKVVLGVEVHHICWIQTNKINIFKGNSHGSKNWKI